VDVVCVIYDRRGYWVMQSKFCTTGATFVGIHETAVCALEQGVKEVIGFNIDGTVRAG
jgi:hypothetical protein